MPDRPRPRHAGWSSFVADRDEERPRALREEGNPAYRVRVEYNRRTLLIHLSDEDGSGWTVVAVDRETRHHAMAQAPRQSEAAQQAHAALYAGDVTKV